MTSPSLTKKKEGKNRMLNFMLCILITIFFKRENIIKYSWTAFTTKLGRKVSPKFCN
jgi:hypothetical protein